MSSSVSGTVRAADFTGSLGINTHIDFGGSYANLTTVEAAINYLDVKNIRDSMENPVDATTWLAVADATGAKFDDYIAETSVGGMSTLLAYMPALAAEGILNFVEGGNEEDDSFPQNLGNTLAATAAFQRQVYAMGQSLGLPSINMSFGSGWTPDNNWHGDYDKVGDLSGYATYANSHTYPNPPNGSPDASIQQLNADAKLAAGSRPAITTEIGWDNANFSQADTARYVLDAALDGMKEGNPKTYFYALYDDGSGQFGLMNADGSARPAGTALHNLQTLLADTGATASTFTATTLAYTLTGRLSTDFSMMLEKSDGSHWLALWNESEAAGSPHSVTLNLGAAASSILVFDPLTGTSTIQTGSGSSISVDVPDHPVLIEIIEGAGAPSPVVPPVVVPPVVIPPVTTPVAGSPLVTLPGTAAATVAKAGPISGVLLSDAWASTASGALVLNLNADQGSFSVRDANGTLLTSTADALRLTGTLAALNAELATLSFTAATAGTAHLTVDLWDQAGQENTKTLAIAVAAPALTPVTTPVVTGGPNPLVVLPAAAIGDVAHVAETLTGVSLSDPWAATVGGNGVLNLSVDQGALAVNNATGASFTLTDTLANLNHDLATMTFTGATAGTAHVTVDYWDQAGQESSKTLNVTVTAAATSNPVPTNPGTGSGPNPFVVLPTASVSGMAHSATALTGVSLSDPWAATVGGNGVLNLSVDQGALAINNATGASFSLADTLANLNHDLATMTFTGATAGTAHVTVDYWDQAGQESSKTLNVTVQAAAANAAVAAVSGNNAAITSLTTNAASTMSFLSSATLAAAAAGGKVTAMPVAGAAAVALTPNFAAGAVLDFRPTMAHTSWDGKLGDLARYVQVGGNASGVTVRMDPTGVTGGASSLVATLHGQGDLTLASLTHHAIF